MQRIESSMRIKSQSNHSNHLSLLLFLFSVSLSVVMFSLARTTPTLVSRACTIARVHSSPTTLTSLTQHQPVILSCSFLTSFQVAKEIKIEEVDKAASSTLKEATKSTIDKASDSTQKISDRVGAVIDTAKSKAMEMKSAVQEELKKRKHPATSATELTPPIKDPLSASREEQRANAGQSTAPRGTSKIGATDRPQQSIVDLIKQDHEMIKILYGQYLNRLDTQAKINLVYTIIYEISRHSACEELVLYPFIRNDSRIPNGAALYEHSLSEHQQIKHDLKGIDSAVKVGDVDFEAQLSKVMEEFMDHGEEEERDLLPTLKKHLGMGCLLNLGERFQNAETIVTTRPHPLAPSEGASGTAVHMMSKPLDMARDAMQGRTRAIQEEEPKAKKEAEKRVKEEKQQP